MWGFSLRNIEGEVGGHGIGSGSGFGSVSEAVSKRPPKPKPKPNRIRNRCSCRCRQPPIQSTPQLEQSHDEEYSRSHK